MDVIVAVDVIAHPVIVAVHVNRNGPVDVIRTVDEGRNHGAVDLRSRSGVWRSTCDRAGVGDGHGLAPPTPD